MSCWKKRGMEKKNVTKTSDGEKTKTCGVEVWFLIEKTSGFSGQRKRLFSWIRHILKLNIRSGRRTVWITIILIVFKPYISVQPFQNDEHDYTLKLHRCHKSYTSGCNCAHNFKMLCNIDNRCGSQKICCNRLEKN